jgi:hypothetical protein
MTNLPRLHPAFTFRSVRSDSRHMRVQEASDRSHRSSFRPCRTRRPCSRGATTTPMPAFPHMRHGQSRPVRLASCASIAVLAAITLVGWVTAAPRSLATVGAPPIANAEKKTSRSDHDGNLRWPSHVPTSPASSADAWLSESVSLISEDSEKWKKCPLSGSGATCGNRRLPTGHPCLGPSRGVDAFRSRQVLLCRWVI